MFYDIENEEEDLANPASDLVLLEDSTGDCVGEFIRPGVYPLVSDPAQAVDVTVESTGQFSGRLVGAFDDGTTRNISASEIVLESAIDADFDTAWWSRPDFGLQARFSDGSGCTGDQIDPETCPLLKRFYVLIDRHENFYSTYSSLQPTCRGSSLCLSSQPSPLVACSVTLQQAHHWDDAGIPDGGTAGFIFLMKVPFNQILTGSTVNVSTIEPPPDVLRVHDLYE